MNTDTSTPVEDHKEKKTPLFEVVNKEKLWWALMHSKGLLNTDVQDLYRKARNCYEKIILNDYEVVELQEVEYCLWKLHYKYIDEFRKRIRPTSSNATSLQNSIDIHTEGFKSFLYEATEFYKDLIIKTRRWYKKDDGSDSVEPSKLHGYQYVHHRFLVCLGDLARYRELCKKTDLENRDWSIASNYYFEATKVCPNSGNPQNQLALLATYVGEDFLALYHCVRSLAVKEPFPDAWDNLMLLFEKNRASHLPSLSVEDCFDFSKPSQRICSSAEPRERKVELWPLFVRTISFFFVKSSLEDFTFTFASTMKELESLLALDDIKLQVYLESYEQMDSARKGPYRALQLVSTFIFILHKLTKNPEPNDPKEKYELALNATFICMGRIIERCNWPDSCHLLAAVLVFIEWLISVLDKVETCSVDEKIDCSISYFFGAFVDLLNRLDTKDGEVANNALWEDYELRGFVPIFQENISVVFPTNLGSSQNYDSDNGSRVHRLFLAAMKIVEKSRKWICYDKSRKIFYTAEMREIEDKSIGEAKEQEHENGNEESEIQSQVQSFVKGESVSIEEEEEILFRPITRYNSAPIYNDEMCGQDSPTDKSPPSDECLRRALSLYDPQNKTQPGSNKPVKLPDPATIPPAGPPSLSAWVINRENLNNIGRTTRDFTKHELTPIEEIDSLIGSTHISEPTQDSSPYIAPLPSAPFLPEDAVWFKGNSPYFPQKNSALGIKEADGILGPPPPPPNWSANLGLFDRSTPFSGMSSSEWLYNYQNSKNFERGGNHVWPVRGNYDSRDAFDRWQSSMVSDPDPTVYMEGPQLYLGPGQINGVGYPMPSLYGCGAGTDFRGEQPQLLQYLKEREWQLQREAQLRGPHYMGN